MSYLLANSYGANTNDTTILRAYGGAISGAFANSGWVKASDSGQIDWSSVTANGTAGATIGSEMWKMGDTLQSTYPIYVKLDYTVYAATNRPGFIVTIGTGSTGSLVLTGITSSIGVVGTNPSNSTVNPCYFCGDTSRMAILMWPIAGGGTFIGIERTHDSQGNDTGEGVSLVLVAPMTGSTPVVYSQYWSYNTGSAPTETNFGIFHPVSLTGVGDRFHFYPIHLSNGVLTNPILNLICGHSNQFIANMPVNVTQYGTSRRYLPITSFASNQTRTATTMFHAMRWD